MRCPSPDTRIRLLSGGNMQKLILGRALDGDPAVILANQPTRGLDVGAVAYVHQRLLAARDARRRGAARSPRTSTRSWRSSDRIVVIYRGRAVQALARGERSIRDLGALMAGHGGEAEGADAA